MSISKLLLLTTLAMAEAGCRSNARPIPSTAPATVPTQDQATFERLDRLRMTILTGQMTDEKLDAEVDDMIRNLSDHQLATVEQYALAESPPNTAFAFAKILLSRERTDVPATIIVTKLADQPENREYALWKWWAYNVEPLPNHNSILTKFTESLIREFDRGTPARKRVVADVFGLGERGAAFSTEELRQDLARRMRKTQ